MKSPSMTKLSLLISPLMLGANLDAQAASPTTKAGTYLPQITVLATKTERNKDLLPESVSVIDSDEVNNRQALNVSDLLEGLPNVTSSGGPRGGAQNQVIRGVDRIVYLLDGVRQSSESRGHKASIYVDPEILKRIEVLRGPASTLWGSGAIGGVISMQTVDADDLLLPGQKFGSRVKLGYQSVSQQQMQGVSAYGRGEAFDFVLNVSHRDAEDLRLGNGKRLKDSGFRRLAGLGKFSWLPDGHSQVSVTVVGLDDKSRAPSNPMIEVSKSSPPINRKIHNENYTLRYVRDDPAVNWLKPSLHVSRQVKNIREHRIPHALWGITARQDSTMTTMNSVDLRNSSQFGERGSFSNVLTYGFEQTHSRVASKRDGLARSSNPDGQSTISSFYLQDEIQLGSALSIIPGLRWDRYESRPRHLVSKKNKDQATSSKLGVNYVVNDSLSLQASYGEAFRAPEVQFLYASGVHFNLGMVPVFGLNGRPVMDPNGKPQLQPARNIFVPNPNLKPEKSRNLELGFRLLQQNVRHEGDRAYLNARVFCNEVKDFMAQYVLFDVKRVIAPNTVVGGITTTRNISSARLNGMEFEAAYDSGRWLLGLSYAQTRGKDKKTRAPLAGIAPDTWVLTAGMTLPKQNLKFGLRSRMVSAQKRVPPPDPKGTGVSTSSSHTVHDLWLSWTPDNAVKGLALNVAINNLFNRNYVPYLDNLPAPGRNFMAMVRYSF